MKLIFSLLLIAGLASSPQDKVNLFMLTASGELVAEPQFWELMEQHCVAVLTEAHTEKVESGGLSYEVDKEGNEIRHVPEQTLKLRCK